MDDKDKISLQEELDLIKQVVKSEKLFNEELKKQLEFKNLQFETILKINDSFLNTITDLRIKLKKLIND